MAQNKKPRTLTLTDEVFDGLQAVALYRKYKGDKSASVSKIIEELAAAYLQNYQREIEIVRKGKAAMDRQMSLFDVDDHE